jgi:hypothetical protein
MLKVRIILEAQEDIYNYVSKCSWQKGDTCELINEVFDKTTGIAFVPIDKNWKVISMELIEYKPIN